MKSITSKVYTIVSRSLYVTRRMSVAELYKVITPEAAAAAAAADAVAAAVESNTAEGEYFFVKGQHLVLSSSTKKV